MHQERQTPDKRLIAGSVVMADRIRAAVVDLDGVVTRTAAVHSAAWKETFDPFLGARGQPEFDIDSDYPRYVDGKPRHDGIRSFLQSRNIELAEGHPDDGPEQDTVYGLGARKNRLFHQRLQRGGVHVFETSIALLRDLRDAGVATAVVSSSRNCAAVLEAAGIGELFDTRVDGEELERLGLRGKPAPDMFEEARRRLHSEAERTIAIEDAAAGIAAARAAGLGCVIGIDRGDRAEALREAGADLVVSDLGELTVSAAQTPAAAPELPSALACLEEIVPGDGQELALFLDYDGTLTPIVPRPEDAVLSASMRSTLQRLAGLCRLAILSGRDLEDVQARVDIADIWYAGSHGFDIAGPSGERMEYQPGRDHLPALDAAEAALHDALDDVAGCQVERKRYAIAVHYRRAAEDQVERIRRETERVREAHPGLRLATGKKIFELKPDIDWHKGTALSWLMEAQNMDFEHYLPIYVGDDETDEDAFEALSGCGAGILVAEGDQKTAASYRLADPDAVQEFLDRLADMLEDA